VHHDGGNQFIIMLLLMGLISLPFYFFKRRIGGAEAGSEADAVGAIWLIATLVLAFMLTRGRV
jgi:hypothetical protein